ncbi:hypothetical protein [Streptomyces flaveolus]|uniref:hypothetical protein n=1 Tax=Streptomyces flaveolus TaxID=67297 RepID=UPI0036F97F0D
MVPLAGLPAHLAPLLGLYGYWAVVFVEDFGVPAPDRGPRDPAPSPAPGESEEAQRGRRLALLQTALLEHAAYNLCTVMTFHQKVQEAAAFAEKLPASSIGAEWGTAHPGVTNV